jgi:hypothetical protein
LVNGVLAGVGGVFVGTHSVLVTVIAAVVAVVLAAMVLAFRRLASIDASQSGFGHRSTSLDPEQLSRHLGRVPTTLWTL